jgi:hypothetical protein
MGVRYQGKFKQINTQHNVGNRPPVWVTDAGLIDTVDESTSYSYAFEAVDPEGGQVAYAVHSGNFPLGLTLAADGTVSGTLPAVATNTSYTFTVRAADPEGAYADRQFIIMVVDTNAPPVWQTASGSLGSVNEGNNFTSTLSATDPEGQAVSFAISNNSLPSGLSLAANGLISGTTTVTGANALSVFTARATDLDGAYAERNFSILVVHSTTKPVWVTNSALSGNERTSYSTTLVANNAISYTITSGALPSGLTFDQYSGEITGNLPAVSTNTGYNFTVTAYSADDSTARNFTLTVVNVNDLPVWSTPRNLGSQLEGNTVSIQLTASDTQSRTITYNYSNGTLPTGTTLSNTGLLSGTLANVAIDTQFDFDVLATNEDGSTARNFNLTVLDSGAAVAPIWVTSTLPNVNEREVYNTTVVASTATSYAVTAGSLPAGLSLNANTGAITGTASSVSSNTTANFTITATNGAGSTPRAFSITVTNVVTAPVWVTNAALPSAYESAPVSIQLQATDVENRTVTYSRQTFVGAPQPPGGLTLLANGLLYGTPYAVNANTTSTFILNAVNADGSTPQQFSMTILNNASLPIWDTSSGLLFEADEGTNIVTIGVANTMQAHDSLGRSISFSIAQGSIPQTAALHPSGYFYGTFPKVQADTDYDLVIAATNPDGSSYQNITIRNKNVATAPTWNTAAGNRASATEGSGSFNFTLSASGADGTPVTYSIVDGALPAGVTLNPTTGNISGSAPRVANTTVYDFTVRADTAEAYADRAFSVTVNNNAVVPVWQTDGGSQGNYYENEDFQVFYFTATHPDLPVLYRLAANSAVLPSPMVLNSNGAITGGTPPVDGGGSVDFTLEAYNSDGVSARRAFSIGVIDRGGAPVWVTPSGSLLTANERTLVSNTVVATPSANSNALTYTILSGATPNGVVLAANGLISGTLAGVTANTTSSFTIRAATPDGHADRAFSMTTINIPAAPVWVTNSALPDQNEGTAISRTLVATGSDGIAVTYSLVNATTLPGTVTLNANTGALSGNVPRANSNVAFNFDVRATTAEGTADRSFSLNVINVPVAPTWNTPAGTILSGTANSVSYQLSATHPDNLSVTYTLANSTTLPNNMTLASNGLITGDLPLVANNVQYDFTVAAASSEGTANRSFTILGLTPLKPPIWETANAFVLPEGNATTYQMVATNNYDLFYANVVAQASFTNAVQDQSPLAQIFTNTGVVVSAAQSKFGGTSGLFNATNTPTGAYLGLNSQGGNFGTSDFTIEMWYFQTSNGARTLYGQRDGSFVGFNMVASETSIQVWRDNVTMINYTGTFAINTWRHVALVRQGTNLTLYVNGTSVATYASFGASYPTYTIAARIGSDNFNNSWVGYMDNVRVTRAARYTANFAVQTVDADSLGITYAYSSGTMPTGLTLNSNGVLTGTSPRVTANTVYTFAANAISNGIASTKTFATTVYNVNTAPTWTTNSGIIASDFGNAAVSTRVLAAHIDNATITYALANATTLPSGVTMNSGGFITGTLPIVSNTTNYSFDVAATAETLSVGRNFTIQALKSTDPYAANVVVLLHGDDNAVGNSITDASGHQTFTMGNAVVSTAAAKFGTKSIYVNGTPTTNARLALDSMQSAANATDFNFGTGDFTLETWVNVTTMGAGTTYPTLMGFCNPTSQALADMAWTFGIRGTGTGASAINQVFFNSYFKDTANGNAAVQVINPTVGVTLATGAWHHIACARQGTNFRFFVNGTMASNTTISAGTTLANPSGNTFQVGIGTIFNSFYTLNGYVDEVRVTKGIARYTATFTPTNGPFPNP